MFKENKRSAETTDTLIGQGTVAEGKLECEANLRIEGQFQGEIHCQGQIIIGETGIATSTISGADVIVAGKVVGDIKTKGRLTITGSGRVDGNVDVSKLIIAEGGLLNGSSVMERTVLEPVLTKEKAKKNNKAQAEAG